jgi:hypothetical protein
MHVPNLTMPPFNTTLMGVLRGVLDHFDVTVSDAMLYGGSGHAFLMNIHETLCPSGPYCWNYGRFLELVQNLGIEMTGRGFFSGTSDSRERAAIESILKGELDGGTPCSLLNLENQLITGYDETGFLTAQPWAPHVDFPPAHLSFGSWSELGDEVHVTFHTFRKVEPAADDRIVADSLQYAVDLHRNPSRHTSRPYAVGAEAFAAWIGAVRNGNGGSHGNWWNGMVWAECRAQASAYFAEIAQTYPVATAPALALAADYRSIAQDLQEVSDKAMEAQSKLSRLERAGAKEADCIPRIEALAAVLA